MSSLQLTRVTRWGGMISTPDSVLQTVIKRALIDSGCPGHIVTELMENSHERRWPPGLSTLEARQLNRRFYENYVCKRIPGTYLPPTSFQQQQQHFYYHYIIHFHVVCCLVNSGEMEGAWPVWSIPIRKSHIISPLISFICSRCTGMSFRTWRPGYFGPFEMVCRECSNVIEWSSYVSVSLSCYLLNCKLVKVQRVAQKFMP